MTHVSRLTLAALTVALLLALALLATANVTADDGKRQSAPPVCVTVTPTPTNVPINGGPAPTLIPDKPG